RRAVRRIPLQCDVELAQGRARSSARMLELSRESCVVSTRTPTALGQRVSLRLPAEHTGADELEIAGNVVRATAMPGSGQLRAITAVIAFDTSDPRAIAHVQDLVAGNVLGTLVTPLRAEPGAASAQLGAESWLGGAAF